MIDAGGLYWITSPQYFDLNNPQWKIFHVYQNDKGNGVLVWVSNPEYVVIYAMNNLNLEVAKNNVNVTYTGQNIINMINNCPTKIYDKIGEWWI